MRLVSAIWMLVVTSITGAQSGSPDGTVPLHVHTGRPLAEMIDKIQHLYVKPVNFEEVPYESSGDLISRSVRQEDGSAVTLLDPPIVDFAVTLGPSDSTVYKAAQSAAAAYTKAGLPGIYEVIPDRRSGERGPQRGPRFHWRDA